MISLNFNLCNPWSNTFKNLWCRAFKTPFNNKYLELEVYQNCTLVSLMINCTTRQDHAGFDFEIGFAGYCLRINFYDSRHWDYARGCYHNKEGNEK
jgi:hypothetical protein